MDVNLPDVKKEIEDTPELKKISDAANLINKIQTGSVKVELVDKNIKKNK